MFQAFAVARGCRYGQHGHVAEQVGAGRLRAEPTEGGDRVVPGAAHLLVERLGDRDVVAHRDVEGAGVVAGAGDAGELVGAGARLPLLHVDGRLRLDRQLDPPHESTVLDDRGHGPSGLRPLRFLTGRQILRPDRGRAASTVVTVSRWPRCGFEPMYDETAAMFTIFADLEGRDLPLYGELCRSAAADESMMALMAEAPKGQRRPGAAVGRGARPAAGGRRASARGVVPDGVRGRPRPRSAIRIRRSSTSWRSTATRSSTRCDTEPRRRTRSTGAACGSPRCATPPPTCPIAPIGLVEVGPSAGLNLGFDRYSYDFGDGTVRGDVTSAVELACEVRAGAPPLDRGAAAGRGARRVGRRADRPDRRARGAMARGVHLAGADRRGSRGSPPRSD